MCLTLALESECSCSVPLTLLSALCSMDIVHALQEERKNWAQALGYTSYEKYKQFFNNFMYCLLVM